MIRGNWSLSSEIRNNERKQQQKIQSRQKHTTKLEKVKNVDPVRLYWRIKRLEDDPDKSERDVKYLKGLKEDWNFIQSNKLHQEKLVPFLEQQERQQRQKEIERNKLWGLKSVYFNPELNPLGKVPVLEHLHPKPTKPLPNITMPLKLKTNYEKDPIIDDLGIVMPEGEPPRFYKSVQNTQKNDIKEVKEEVKTAEDINPMRADLPEDDEVSSDPESGEDDFVSKRQKFH